MAAQEQSTELARVAEAVAAAETELVAVAEAEPTQQASHPPSKRRTRFVALGR